MRLWVLLLTAAASFGQTAANTYPDAFLSMGLSYDRYAPEAQGSKVAGWISLGASVGTNSGTYSLSTVDVTYKYTAIRTGVAKVVNQTSDWVLLAYADGGVAAPVSSSAAGTTSTSLLGTFSAGGILLYKMPNNYYAVFAMRFMNVATVGTYPIGEVGFGKAF